MTGIVVTGHGHFPSGLMSAVELVAGRPDNVCVVDYEGGQSPEELKLSLKAAVDGLKGDEILILADLAGGTPFNMAALLREELLEKGIRVLAGINMAGMVEAVFSQSIMPFGQLADQVERAAKDGVVSLEGLDGGSGGPEFEDGL